MGIKRPEAFETEEKNHRRKREEEIKEENRMREIDEIKISREGNEYSSS